MPSASRRAIITKSLTPHAAHSAMQRPTTSIADDVDSRDSRSSTIESSLPSSLKSVCAELHQRVSAFLEEDIPDGLLKQVQIQTRHALKTLEEALAKYG